ncbi:MAG: AbrB/MazE/SpoVT family DNA-binding domain-containing protein [Oscillospiraceae bacterium]|nr:AbrB/MazE/SpoVT family DNA-binding domain-containing protein [Oscillospiraceae bacterium]
MKATGIVRRIDDLGRVVIPKEIRRTLRIREGDPLEIYTDNEGEVIFKKYSPIGEISTFASQYVEVLNKTGDLPAVVCDKDHVVAVAGLPKKEILERRVSPSLDEIMESRKTYIYSEKSERTIRPIEGVDKHALVCVPIVSSGDAIGVIMFLSSDDKNTANDTQVKLVQAAALFIGKQMEE